MFVKALTKNKYLFCGFLSAALTRDHLPPGLINPHTLGPGSPTWVWFNYVNTHLNTFNTLALVVQRKDEGSFNLDTGELSCPSLRVAPPWQLVSYG